MGRGDSERSQKVVRSRDGAVEQQEPSSLEIREGRDPVQKTLLVTEAFLQDACDKFRAANRRPENDEAVMRGVEITFPQWRRRPRLAAEESINSGRLWPSLARPKRELPELRLNACPFLDLLRDVVGNGRGAVAARDCVDIV